MNILKYISILFLFQMASFSQILFDETFSNGVFPSPGWTIDNHLNHWSYAGTNYAGGERGEIRFAFNPIFIGQSRYISPLFDLTGKDQLKLSFRYLVDHYDGDYKLGVATRSNNGNWTPVWEINSPSGDTEAITVDLEIKNEDVGSNHFQICWYFDGNSGNISSWYLDDLFLAGILPHDLKVADIIHIPYVANTPLVPKAILQNIGQNDETFQAGCQIKVEDNIVYEKTISSINLASEQTKIIEFPEYSSPVQNVEYEISVYIDLESDLDNTNNFITEKSNTFTAKLGSVLFETATGTWCEPCQVTARVLDKLIEDEVSISVIEYHASDPFQSPYASARWTYYNIIELTEPIFEGIKYSHPGTKDNIVYDRYMEIVNDRIVFNSAYSINVTGTNEGLDYYVYIDLEQVGIKEPESNLTLQAVLTESHIDYEWFNETEVNFAERLMIPDENGTPVLLNDQGASANVELNFVLDSGWIADNCELIVFLQNMDTKRIFQTEVIKLPELGTTSIDTNDETLVLEFNLSQNYPNPFNPSTTIKYSVAERTPVKITIFNIMGERVTTLVNGIKDAGKYSIVFDGSNLASGIYFYSMEAGRFQNVKKLTILK